VAHRDELNAVISAGFAELSTQALESRLTNARIAFAGVNTVAEFLEHPVLQARDRWRETATEAGPVRALLPPIDLGVEPRMDAVPALGEHTDKILAELGRDPTTLAKSSVQG
jgi:crotonobetainyl-CoA:carnitine CoA-transferase CaiB-like acyl-CoA transferase